MGVVFCRNAPGENSLIIYLEHQKIQWNVKLAPKGQSKQRIKRSCLPQPFIQKRLLKLQKNGLLSLFIYRFECEPPHNRTAENTCQPIYYAFLFCVFVSLCFIFRALLFFILSSFPQEAIH